MVSKMPIKAWIFLLRLGSLDINGDIPTLENFFDPALGKYLGKGRPVLQKSRIMKSIFFTNIKEKVQPCKLEQNEKNMNEITTEKHMSHNKFLALWKMRR